MTNAQSVVDENSGKGNYEKLVAYREWIKNAVSYNDEAAKEGESTAYGNPWQLVYVFDGDSSTNVVCEGYAKAFKYLCDLTWPDGEPVCCYLATGEISGDNVQGGHMWNIVSIGGKNYLADITNCDTEMGGYPDKLFLCGVSGSMSGGYTAEGVTYKYDDYITQVYDAAELELSETAYTPPTTYTIEQISALARYIAGIDSATPTLTDPNGDGATDAKDLTYMANHMA